MGDKLQPLPLTVGYRMSSNGVLAVLIAVALARPSWGCLPPPPPVSSPDSSLASSPTSSPDQTSPDSSTSVSDPSVPTGTTSSCSTEPDTRCKEAKGYCMDASSCPQGNFTDNMCPGDASNK